MQDCPGINGNAQIPLTRDDLNQILLSRTSVNGDLLQRVKNMEPNKAPRKLVVNLSSLTPAPALAQATVPPISSLSYSPATGNALPEETQSSKVAEAEPAFAVATAPAPAFAEAPAPAPAPAPAFALAEPEPNKTRKRKTNLLADEDMFADRSLHPRKPYKPKKLNLLNNSGSSTTKRRRRKRLKSLRRKTTVDKNATVKMPPEIPNLEAQTQVLPKEPPNETQVPEPPNETQAVTNAATNGAMDLNP